MPLQAYADIAFRNTVPAKLVLSPSKATKGNGARKVRHADSHLLLHQGVEDTSLGNKKRNHKKVSNSKG